MEWTESLLTYYQANARDLPWRRTRDPYRIWISEIMLQQTRVEAVRGYYARFLETLPNIASLAAVEEDRLLKLWEGLGYYSRARNLKRAAEVIQKEHGGALPRDYDALLKLPGIGAYTAGAIASIAFDIPVPAVDGNVLRVIARKDADDADILAASTRRRVRDTLLDCMPKDRPGMFNQAMMELGATVCVPNGAPHCDICPIAFCCKAHLAGNETDYPVKAKKAARRIEQKTVFAVETPKGYLGCRRPDKGLLAGLFQLPDTMGRLSDAEMMDWLGAHGLHPTGEIRMYERVHIFTHVEWHMRVCAVSLSKVPPLPDSWLVLDKDQHSLPTAYRICLPFDRMEMPAVE